jgi:hypothetical protein
MKITKEEIRKIVVEKLQEQETDRMAQRAGATKTGDADEFTRDLIQKIENFGALKAELIRLKKTAQGKIALTRALLMQIAEINPELMDQMVQVLVRAAQKK